MTGDLYNLAGTDMSVPLLGVGTWAWGDKSVWGMGGYDSQLTFDTIRDAWSASIDAGATFFDTAEVYGRGESERIIGRLLAEDPERAKSVTLATKFMPSPSKLRVHNALMKSLRASLNRLGVATVGLYQIHGPVSLRSHAALAEALAAAHSAGLVKAVGVSNYSAKEVTSISNELRARGVSLASNQIEFSLLRRMPETGGLLAACKELGVLPLAYSPLGQGRLTGKYSAANPPPGKRGFSAHPMDVVDRIVAELRRLGEAYDGKTPSQVALNWLISKGVLPIPGAKNRQQAEQNAGALNWSLTAEDVEMLDRVSLQGLRTISNRIWQHG
ncbi:MAG: aldo/keto reductase [Acidimicrobiales bacterium]